jgi:hypothetical protein
MKSAAATRRMSRKGSFSAAYRPANTTGTFAASMPSVVPTTTQPIALYFAASSAVATCVLSPISTRKKAIKVERNAP